MKRLSAVGTTLLVVALGGFGCAEMESTVDSMMGWNALIDGDKGLENWNRAGQANWRAEDGAIVADRKVGKEGAFLVSKKSYTDFELRVEFWASPDSNSGIYMRCADPRKLTDRTCYEANIFDTRKDQTYATGGIVHHAPVLVPTKAGGKWNTYQITVRGTKLVVMLNGVKTSELDHSQFASGPIALQYGQGVVKFRKVLIKEL